MKHGILLVVVMIIATGLSAQRNRVDYVMSNPELPASLPACMDMPDMYRENCNARQIRDWVRNHLEYPEEAKARGIEGRVEVAVTIDTLGKMGLMRVSKKVDPILNKEAMRIVTALKDSGVVWLPAMHKGLKVISEYRIPVTFYATQPKVRRAPTDQDGK
ncbi:MAG: energy transducer TonB [Saprospiraceae bacterium]|nr:energy transducer TonB [Saprospiraceae bacterium]